MSGTPNSLEKFDNNDTSMGEIDDQTLHDLYSWIDKITFSRPKKNLNRDFSDGVMMAELIRHYLPKYIEMHNYTPANSTKQKMDNWFVLNRKVFRKMNFEVTEEVVRQIALGRPWVIEHVLLMLRTKIDKVIRNESGSQEIPTAQSNSPKPVARAAAKPTRPPAANTAPQLAAPPHTTPRAATGPPPDLVSRVVLEEKEQELLAKEETIQILQAKVRRLEHLVHLKDVRIDDLQTKLAEMRPTAQNAPSTTRTLPPKR